METGEEALQIRLFSLLLLIQEQKLINNNLNYSFEVLP